MVTPAQNTSVDTVIFDFGNVVVRWSMAALLQEFFETEGEMEHFLTHVLTPLDNYRCDLGEPLAHVVGELVERHPAHRVPLEAWRDRWIETIPGMVEGTEQLIDDLLSSDYRVVGLSNFSAETFPVCAERYPVFNKFADIVLSGVEGVGKPDPEIYRRLLDRNGLQAEQCVFLDDSLANVEGGEALGIRSHLFTNAATARFWLRQEIGLAGI